MNDELLLPTELAISLIGSNTNTVISVSSSSALNEISTISQSPEESTSEEEVRRKVSRVGTNEIAVVHPSRRFVANKRRHKSRNKMKVTQVNSEEVANTNSLRGRPETDSLEGNERLRSSVSTPSLMAFDSDNTTSSSSSKMGADRKINRIFTMLQSMQHNFMQQQQLQQADNPTKEGQYPQQGIQQQTVSTPVSVAAPVHLELTEVNSIRPQHLELELNPSSLSSSHKRLLGLGRSRDSLMSGLSAGAVSMMKEKPFLSKNNSWAGSQISGFTCASTVMTEGPPPPLVHALPYHKDGWTSLFIVGSSTYAQLLIVLCIVAALSEVVTHNVPFQYFEIYFASLYVLSILFFLYVFGYLLRSKRRREEKKRLRKLSRSRRLSNMTNPQSSEDESDFDRRISHNASVSMENEIFTADSPVDRFMVGHADGQRRRGSGTESASETKGEFLKSEKSNKSQEKSLKKWSSRSSVTFNLGEDLPGDVVSYSMMGDNKTRKIKKMKVSDNDHSHGSFFLRVGAVAFGLGTMIYDGLEFGAFLEVPPESPCFSLIRGLNPLLHATFVFLQMYFIFISARLNIHKFKAIARFGLMHVLATNVCVWIRTLVRESLKEINGHFPHYEKAQKQMKFGAPAIPNDNFLNHVAEAVAAVVGNNEDSSSSSEGSSSAEFMNDTLAEMVDAAVNTIKSKKVMSLWELTGNVSCGHQFFLGDMIMDAAPFLYPFLIEYSLIGAAVLYVTWSHIGLNPKYKTEENRNDASIWNSSKSRQLRVDCVGASKGLFVGLIFLTATLLCLVLFFIFTPQAQFHRLGLFLADTAHCILLLVSICAMALGAYRARHLHFHADHMEELGSILLRVSALGMFSYSVFSMIAGALTNSSTHEPPILVFINGLLSVVEVTVQTLFISDMSRRSVSTPEQDREKPGRQSVTFLLITNMTLWLVYTFEMQKVEANPVQLNFYGLFPWAIVQRITLPLCIFYRFHSAIVYSEIWKNSYRYHGPSIEALAHQH